MYNVTLPVKRTLAIVYMYMYMYTYVHVLMYIHVDLAASEIAITMSDFQICVRPSSS